MARLKVLFADDQIPDEDIPDAELASALKKKYPAVDPGFIKAFKPMRQAVMQIRSGYDVTVANTYNAALNAIKQTHFDIAIIDLRWDGDLAVPPSESENWGWEICDAIEKADESAPLPHTFQVICSSRFNREPHIALIAAQKSKLPVYKSYNEAGSLSLLASLNFIEKHLFNSISREKVLIDSISSAWDSIKRSMTAAIHQEQQWSKTTLALVITSVVLLLFGALMALFGQTQIGTLTAIGSLFTSVISTILFVELKRKQKLTQDRMEFFIKTYQEGMKELRENQPTKV